MRIIVTGLYGKMGEELLQALVVEGHKVTQIDKDPVRPESIKNRFRSIRADILSGKIVREELTGADVIISGLGRINSRDRLRASASEADINMRLIGIAKENHIPRFILISTLHAERGKHIPALNAALRNEKALKESGLSYLILRPAFFFDDILLSVSHQSKNGRLYLPRFNCPHTNPLSPSAFADLTVRHLTGPDEEINPGGAEVYSLYAAAQLVLTAEGKKHWIIPLPKLYYKAGSMIAGFRKDHENEQPDISQYMYWLVTTGQKAETVIGSESFCDYVRDHQTEK